MKYVLLCLCLLVFNSCDIEKNISKKITIILNTAIKVDRILLDSYVIINTDTLNIVDTNWENQSVILSNGIERSFDSIEYNLLPVENSIKINYLINKLEKTL